MTNRLPFIALYVRDTPAQPPNNETAAQWWPATAHTESLIEPSPTSMAVDSYITFTDQLFNDVAMCRATGPGTCEVEEFRANDVEAQTALGWQRIKRRSDLENSDSLSVFATGNK